MPEGSKQVREPNRVQMYVVRDTGTWSYLEVTGMDSKYQEYGIETISDLEELPDEQE